jgi:hypothetical protein
LEGLLLFHTPSHSTHISLYPEGDSERDRGDHCCAGMARATMGRAAASDHDSSGGSGKVSGHPSTRPSHGESGYAVATRHPSDVPHGRVNQDGWDMWNSVMNQMNLDDGVKASVQEVRGPSAQRAHCAALARFVRVCKHLSLSWETVTSSDQLQPIVTKVLDWSGRNGAPASDLKRIRSAVSVLYDYRFQVQMSDNSLVNSVVRRHALHDLPVRTPLRLN